MCNITCVSLENPDDVRGVQKSTCPPRFPSSSVCRAAVYVVPSSYASRTTNCQRKVHTECKQAVKLLNFLGKTYFGAFWRQELLRLGG